MWLQGKRQRKDVYIPRPLVECKYGVLNEEDTAVWAMGVCVFCRFIPIGPCGVDESDWRINKQMCPT